MVYAIVRAGGRQEKVAVGDVITLDRLQEEVDANVELPAVLLVDGDKVTSDADSLSGVKVQGKVLGHERGQKIVIQKYKNKTGYKKRQGFRAALSKVEITSIA